MFSDLLSVLKKHESWLFLAWMDIVLRYRRTVLGPFWLVIATFFSVIPLAFVASALFQSSFWDYFPYVACGMVIWTYITVIINESCNVFVSQDGIIKNVNAPLLSFCIRLFVRNTLAFAHSLLIILVILFFSHHLNGNILYFFPGLLLFGINTFSIAVILGFLAARMRDIGQAIGALMSLLTFVTPVIWRPEMLSGKRVILAYANPLYHFVSLLRDPLMGKAPAWSSVGGSIGFTLLVLWLAKKVYERYRTRLVFWL